MKKIIQDKLSQLDNGKGVLVMTDMYGATPTNIIKKLISPNKHEVITGLNLPMLMQALTNRNLSLDELMKICLKYGQQNIFNIKK
jgi:mannose/fructose-specific phosphotransferase system component IIA